MKQIIKANKTAEDKAIGSMTICLGKKFTDRFSFNLSGKNSVANIVQPYYLISAFPPSFFLIR